MLQQLNYQNIAADCGVSAIGMLPGSANFGHAFEHFIIQELIAYIGYNILAKTLEQKDCLIIDR